jgi:hypothetical protein
MKIFHNNHLYFAALGKYGQKYKAKAAVILKMPKFRATFPHPQHVKIDLVGEIKLYMSDSYPAFFLLIATTSNKNF